MSMQTRTCCHCGHHYEWYQVANTVPNCPSCGADAVTHRPMTSDEFYKGIGVPKGGGPGQLPPRPHGLGLNCSKCYPVQYGRTNARTPE